MTPQHHRPGAPLLALLVAGLLLGGCGQKGPLFLPPEPPPLPASTTPPADTAPIAPADGGTTDSDR